MRDQELERNKQELLRLRSELNEQEESSKDTAKTVELDQSRVGRLTRMDALQVQQIALEASRRRRHHLLSIEGALRRIESGEYGNCFICGDEIDIRRLNIDPTSTRCKECVEK